MNKIELRRPTNIVSKHNNIKTDKLENTKCIMAIAGLYILFANGIVKGAKDVIRHC